VDQDPDADVIEAIYDALERDDAGQAWSLASEALAATEADDPVLRYLGGRALLQLGRPADAAGELGRAVQLDPEDPEFRVYLAWALFRACRFAEAEREIRRVGAVGDALGETHYVRALSLERARRFDEAERCYERAAAADPLAFPRPVRFSEEAFARSLDEARRGLPDPFRHHLAQVTVIVEDLPSQGLLAESEPPLDPEELLGLFTGPTLDEPHAFSPGGELPPRIYLFKRNLERSVADPAELADEIRVTLWHELGHYLGLDEEELEASGYE
jgi:predicted Zn-dependent protease with MMP-like domain